MFDYILSRLKEVSTWQGLIVAATAFGLKLSPEQGNAIIQAAFAVFAAISVFIPSHATTATTAISARKLDASK